MNLLLKIYKKMLFRRLRLLLPVLLLLLSCDKIEFKWDLSRKPVVEIASRYSNAFESTCTIRIVDDGGSPVTDCGICYSRHSNPSLMDSIVRSSSHTGIISIKVTGLTPGTTYYSKPFASNILGTGYGDIDQFTTDDFLVTTNPISLITQTTARCGGYIPGNGGVSIIARGVCWDVSPNPTTALNKTVDGSGTGTFVSDLTGLRPSTTYYVKAYVSAREGTAYGSEKIFTTTQAAIPTLTTTAISSVTVSSAVTGGTVTSDGGATITDRGICWNTTGNPTVTNSKISIGSGAVAKNLN